jgi:hypothetical protein
MPWNQMNASLGVLPSDAAQIITYALPLMPAGSTEILVFAWVRTGNANFQPDCEFFISVDNPDIDHPAGFYLFSAGYTSTDFAYNSDNVWLPIPPSGELHAKISSGQGYTAGFVSGLRIVACR